jgi:hypothetical protein
MAITTGTVKTTRGILSDPSGNAQANTPWGGQTANPATIAPNAGQLFANGLPSANLATGGQPAGSTNPADYMAYTQPNYSMNMPTTPGAIQGSGFTPYSFVPQNNQSNTGSQNGMTANGGTPTKPPVLPYQTVPNGLVQPVQPTQPGPYNPTTNVQGVNQQGGQYANPQTVQGVQFSENPYMQNLLQQGAQTAAQGFQSPVSDLLSYRTLQLMQDPNLGAQSLVDPTLAQYDRNTAAQQEALRQQLAPTLNTGQMQGRIADVAFQSAQGRTDLQNQLAMKEQENQRSNFLQALAEGRSTAEAERARQELNIGSIVDVLGAGEGQANRALEVGVTEFQQRATSAENAANRGLELAMQSNDQVFQGNMQNAQQSFQYGMALNDQQFEAVQNDINRQLQLAMQNNDYAMAYELQNFKQQFEGTQAELERANALEMQDLAFNQEKWMQGREEALTAAGWDKEDARLQASFEQERWSTQYNAELEKALQSGQNQFEAEQTAMQLATTVAEASLDRQLTREVEAGKLTLEEARITQQAMQFDDELEFRQSELAATLTEAEKSRIWESTENIADRSHESQMTYLRNKLGVEFGTVMAAIEGMDPTQQAEYLRTIAAESGFEIPMPTEEATLRNRAQTVDDILSGTISVNALVGNTELYQAALSSGKIPTSTNARVVKPSGGGNNYHSFATYDTALENNTPVIYNGKIYLVTNRENINKAGNDNSRYTLTDIRTGETTTRIAE